MQPRKVQLRAWNTLPQQDLSLSSEQFAEGSYQQRAHDEHTLRLITDRFRLRAGHLRHMFRCASRIHLCDWQLRLLASSTCKGQLLHTHALVSWEAARGPYAVLSNLSHLATPQLEVRLRVTTGSSMQTRAQQSACASSRPR